MFINVFNVENIPVCVKTSRDRPKSAPYPRLKNSKKTSKCQVFFYSSRKSKTFRNFFLEKLHTKKMDRVARRGSLARALGALTSHNAEKLKGGTLWDFPTSILSRNIKKMQGGPFEEKNFEKKSEKNVSQCRKKNERGDSLVSPGMVCYAEKPVKPFWSSSLGQMVQFDTIIFCRTFENYFGQFVWIEKKSL